MHKERSQQKPPPAPPPLRPCLHCVCLAAYVKLERANLGGRKDIFGIWYSFVYFSQYFVINVYTSVSYSEMAPPLGGGNVG